MEPINIEPLDIDIKPMNVNDIGTLVSFLPREIALPIITESDLTLPIITESDISSMFLEAERRLLSLNPAGVDIVISERNEILDIPAEKVTSIYRK